MDRHQIDLYNQALKDYDEAIIKIETLEKELEESTTREARLRSDNYDLHKDLFQYKQSVKRIRALAVHLRGRCGQVIPYEITEIIQECEVTR